MSETWYRASDYCDVEIVAVEASSSTEHTVTANGRRYNKTTERECYFRTPQEAAKWLIEKRQQEAKAAESRLTYAQKRLELAQAAVVKRLSELTKQEGD